MIKKYLSLSVAALAFSATTTAQAYNRIFPLYLQNNSAETIHFKINDYVYNCYEGSPGLGAQLGSYAPGQRAGITIARIQGHGCDGQNGQFAVEWYSNSLSGIQEFTYTNDGYLWPSSAPNNTLTSMSPKSPTDESYTFSIQGQLATTNLKYPESRIANDIGQWGNDSRIQSFHFESGGWWGNYYDDCSGVELFHPQHIVRLANKNGRAYFVVSQSRAHNGWISVLETAPGVLDPVTDLLNPPAGGGFTGKYIWQDLYRWIDQQPNPIGNWNHPGKMEVIGDVLVVAAENWAANPYSQIICPSGGKTGHSPDSLLFYDVSNPAQPRFWGAMTHGQLGLSKISSVGIVKMPNNEYVLTVGGNGKITTLRAPQVSPNINDWQIVAYRNGQYWVGQHGMIFRSKQEQNTLPGSSVAKGAARYIYFDSADRNKFTFKEYTADADGYNLSTTAYSEQHLGLPGANRDWDADSAYVTKNGAVAIYTVKSNYGQNGEIYQVNPATSTANLNTPNFSSFCAREGELCQINGTRLVNYGANGAYTGKMMSGSFYCSNAAFDEQVDPGNNACYVSNDSFTHCGSENGYCNFDGTKTIQYGTKGKFVSKVATNGIGCDNGNFGDPAHGYGKQCYINDNSQPICQGGTCDVALYCASENNTCNMSGTRLVHYGANGVYAKKWMTGNFACNNQTFGDPLYGTYKYCYVSEAN